MVSRDGQTHSSEEHACKRFKEFSLSCSLGQPISAKLELEDGKLQLSVYTQKGGAFSEVAVDHDTGSINQTEVITTGEDLEAAKTQSQAMSGAKSSLSAAVDKAALENSGYVAVSVFPELAGGSAAAKVTLAKGEESKTVSETLQ
jgi:uncharacterized membrane protein YkoI